MYILLAEARSEPVAVCAGNISELKTIWQRKCLGIRVWSKGGGAHQRVVPICSKPKFLTGHGSHPVVIPGADPSPEGVYVCPDSSGATNWAASSFDPKANLFFVAVREACAVYTSKPAEPIPGVAYTGTGQQIDQTVGTSGAIRALDPGTGEMRWNVSIEEGSSGAGVLGTAGGVVFASSQDGNLIALDASNGTPLWHYQTGGSIRSSPMSYAVDGK